MFFFKLSFEIFHGSSRISLLPQINLITFLSALYAKFLMLTLNVLFYFMSCILINYSYFWMSICEAQIYFKDIFLLAPSHDPFPRKYFANSVFATMVFLAYFFFFLTKLRSPSFYASDFVLPMCSLSFKVQPVKF